MREGVGGQGRVVASRKGRSRVSVCLLAVCAEYEEEGGGGRKARIRDGGRTLSSGVQGIGRPRWTFEVVSIMLHCSGIMPWLV